jgi:hypothetical protein
MGRGEVHRGFCWENLREGDHLEDPDLKRKNNIKTDLREVEYGGTAWIDLEQDRDRFGWAGYVARLGRGAMHTGFWWENLSEGDHLEDSGVEERIILK